MSNSSKVTLDTPQFRYEFGEQYFLDEAHKHILLGQAYGMRLSGRHYYLVQFANVVYDKGRGKYIKHRQVGDSLANEILEFTR